MPVLTVQLTAKEKALLARRAKREGSTPAGLIRDFIHLEPFDTGADVLKDLLPRLGDQSLRIRRKK